MPARGSRLARAVVVALALPACRDASPTADVDTAATVPPGHPMAGTWDLTTRLTAFSFETPAPSPPDCPDYTLYCTHSRAPGEGSLVGTFVIESPSQLSPTLTELSMHGTFTARFCEAIDYVKLSGCARTAAAATLEYGHGSAWVAYPFDASAPFLAVLNGPGASDGYIRFQTARLQGDSLFGDVYWAMSMGRSPPSYRGTFVARRRGAGR